MVHFDNTLQFWKLSLKHEILKLILKFYFY